MKKRVLLFSMFLLFASPKLLAAITVTLQSTLTTSTTYPGYYDVKLSLTGFDNSLCGAGKYTFSVERKQLYTPLQPQPQTTWSQMTLATQFPVDNTPDGVYSGSGYTYLLAGTRFAYRVKVTYSGNGCATVTKYSPEVICEGARPDFRLTTGQIDPPTNGDPQTLCISNELYINMKYCELEPAYFLEITECNRWWSTSGNYSVHKWYLTSAPDVNKSLQDFVYESNVTWTAGPPSSKTLLGGTITAGPLAGQERYYRVTVATNSPTWMTRGALIRVDMGCRAIVVEEKDEMEMAQLSETLKLYPNPVKDDLNVNLKSDQLIKKISLFDMNNSLINEKEYDGSSNQAVVNMNELKKGIYVIVIETTTDVVKNKIVKE